MKPLVAAFLLLALAAVPAAAQQPALSLTAHNDRTGYIGLGVSGPPGAAVTLFETTGGALRPVGQLQLSGPAGDVPRAARWACTPRRRTFRAEARTADGQVLTADTTTVTPRCRKRFTLQVRPAHPRARRPLTVLLEDSWKVGGTKARACANGPGPRRRCHTIALREHRRRSAWRFRPGVSGRWRIEVRIPGAPKRRETAHVRPASGRLHLLATGDSMIQIIDGFLERRLASEKVGVRSDARISTGISKPFLLNWPAHARSQARRLRPDATVVFLGANDGYPLRTRRGRRVDCCGRAWIAAYARRAGAMMTAYARRGAGSVYWATLPAPRSSSFRRVYRAVNAALREAAARHPAEVRLVRLDRRFTPGYRFRQTIRWHGQRVSVRQGDGVHLNVKGASIAATLIIREMRRDGVL